MFTISADNLVQKIFLRFAICNKSISIMETSTLQKKKNTISKGKLKKTIKNVLCRPDQVFWPEITQEESLRLESILGKYKVKIPEFKKPLWKELKLIAKENRPKPPKFRNIDGLLFGISECSNAIEQCLCSAIIIESTVNPRMIVETVIEMCSSKEIPVLCMKDLRNLTLTNFGVRTSCLGVKEEYLPDVQHEILDISKSYLRPKVNSTTIGNIKVEKMDIESKMEVNFNITVMDVSESPYLYRTNKKTRVFVPTGHDNLNKPKDFIGQDFIEFSGKAEQKESKSYMKMILKRISNNPDRGKKK